MSDLSRRSVAKGTAWSIPTLAVAAAAPSMAASPCAGIVKGQPLPASAFTPVYLAVTNQTFGLSANKAITVIAGVKVTPAVQACVGAASLSLASASVSSRLALTNGNSYDVSTGSQAAGSGTAGVTNGGCSGGDNSAQACITQTGMSVQNSTRTNTANPTKLSLAQTITVSGYGTTTIYLNALSFTQSGTTWNGGALSITAGPGF